MVEWRCHRKKWKIHRNYCLKERKRRENKRQKRHKGLWDGISQKESQKEKWKNGAKKKKIEEIMAENTWNLVNDTNLQIQKAQWSPGRINLKQTTPRHILNYSLPHLPPPHKNIKKKSWLEKRTHCLEENNNMNHLSVLSETTEARRQ